MSMRCAGCGSNKVTETTKKDSFSMGKAVAGTVLFGPVGAVMGVNGKETKWYYCPTCGATLNRLMPDYIASSIDASILTGGTDSMRASYWGAEWKDSTVNVPTFSFFSSEDQVTLLIKNELERESMYKDDLVDRVGEKLLEMNYRGLNFLDDRYKQVLTLCEEKVKNCIKEMHLDGRLLCDNGLKNTYDFSDCIQYSFCRLTYISNDNQARRNSLIIKGMNLYKDNYKIITAAFKELLMSFPEDTISKGEFEKCAYELTASHGWGNNDVTAQIVFESFINNTVWCDYEGDIVKINRLFITDEKEMKMEKLRRAEAKRLAENETIANSVSSILTDGNKYTLTSMLENLNKIEIFESIDISEYRIESIFRSMKRNGEVASKTVKKTTYFYSPKAVEEKHMREEQEKTKREARERAEREERLRIERERRERIDAQTVPIKQQMAQKQQELNEQTRIYNENKRKILGKGAKIKKDAQDKMNVLLNEISQLKNEIARIEAQ
ncbi:MAG: hypothetical protein NC299_17215 [Lachnospiraceae bacterium]|nr:hypothetical protein [Ruminococcus sp.]MCM1277071.1 hypothetical protein [Lachnospiraceae bacterium]